MGKIGRNQRCPCGSGKKYKHCCLQRHRAEVKVDAEHRVLAMTALTELVRARFDEQYLEATEYLWGEHLSRVAEVNEYGMQTSQVVLDTWFWFDRPLDDGRLVVDVLLASPVGLDSGVRTWLTRMRETCMRPYEVVDVRPGTSITLRNILDGTQVSVHERTLSRSARRGMALAARVIQAGLSGQPELELSVVEIPFFTREDVIQQLGEWHDDFRRKHPTAPDTTFWKLTPPFFHSAWMAVLLDPVIPILKNSEGEDLVLTEVHFEVLDRQRLEKALDAHRELERHDETSWDWEGGDPAEPTALGRLELGEKKLVFEVNSVARGERGRALVEAAAGEAVRFVAASHEDPTESIRDQLRSGKPMPSPAPADDEIPPEILEEMTLNHLSRHYREWIDYPVPALGGETPRAAAGQQALRTKLVELIRGIEGQYQTALRRQEPAYDPSWMWQELDMEPDQEATPPPMAHEQLDASHPGLGVLSQQVAERLRRRPDFDDRTQRCRSEDLKLDLDARRFLERHPAATSLLPWLVDFELHRRKIFWVDDALAWQLAQTDLDVAADDLQLPFAVLALVFTDRTVLSLAERLVAARGDSPIAGHFARVVTVFVSTVFASQTARSLRLHIVVDAGGSDPPEVIEHGVALAGRIAGCEPGKIPAPMSGLVHVVANAILYATSPGAPTRRDPAAPDAAPSSEEGYHSEEVWYLPGVIKISQLRQLQDLERAPSGRKLLHRHMVRGHWRKPPKTWKDQRLRWIEPHWKGPELSAIIERAYKLAP